MFKWNALRVQCLRSNCDIVVVFEHFSFRPIRGIAFLEMVVRVDKGRSRIFVFHKLFTKL